jgi:hypothetical protein
MRIGIGLPGPFWVSGNINPAGGLTLFRLMIWVPVLLLTFLAALAGLLAAMVLYSATRGVAMMRHKTWKHSWKQGLAWSACQGGLIGMLGMLAYFVGAILVALGAWWLIPLLIPAFVFVIRWANRRPDRTPSQQAAGNNDRHQEAETWNSEDDEEFLHVEQAANALRYHVTNDLPIGVELRHYIEDWLRSDLQPVDRVAYLMRLDEGDPPEGVYWYVTERLQHRVRVTRRTPRYAV